eukprot:CAMPEP_0119107986 /NCGR_PEP_ID=MMETSP1180-20130426/12811_1 /TAXON_ID=3052 ORGANISM="Chlamydomonas cf sp, Strain CCMP681" /NCGR_SAMPLE_ID=MMETSP1180 /ASSEMBLY_ACC=CAM_ASM_000741 /LENGTH=228 /DNA_ID=CAMNT_0007093541 /DNA_START=78 /DNA_END=765 /DNA_ORIENTATION=+
MAMLPAATLMRQLEPYKRVLGVLLRGSCVSLAVSNPYLSLAEPAGAIMLRAGGKVPEHALQKLLAIHAPELAGVVWGHDAMTQQQVEHSPQAAATLAQVQDVLRRVAKLELPACWHADWDPLSPAFAGSCPQGVRLQQPQHRSNLTSPAKYLGLQRQCGAQQQRSGQQVARQPVASHRAPWHNCSYRTTWTPSAHKTHLDDCTPLIWVAKFLMASLDVAHLDFGLAND